MSRMEALRSYTILNAFAAFEEDVKGSLTAGKLADITVLSKDITSVEAGKNGPAPSLGSWHCMSPLRISNKMPVSRAMFRRQVPVPSGI